MITTKQLEVMSRYLEYRKNGEIEKCLELMSDKITIISEKDGESKGKSQVRHYLLKNKFQGEWSQPYWSRDDNMIRTDGRVKLFLVPINVKILTRFNASDQIESVWIGRR